MEAKQIKRPSMKVLSDGLLERMVEAALKSVPNSIQIYDRKGSMAVNLEGDNCNFCSAGDAITIWDYTLNKVRQPRVKDQIEFYRLVDCLDNIDAH